MYNRGLNETCKEIEIKSTCIFFYQIDLFQCKMFVHHSIIARGKSTRTNLIQLGTPLASPGLTEEQRVPALLISDSQTDRYQTPGPFT